MFLLSLSLSLSQTPNLWCRVGSTATRVSRPGPGLAALFQQPGETPVMMGVARRRHKGPPRDSRLHAEWPWVRTEHRPAPECLRY